MPHPLLDPRQNEFQARLRALGVSKVANAVLAPLLMRRRHLTMATDDVAIDKGERFS